MKDRIIELLCILAFSKRTQWALILGVVGFIGIHVWGQYHLSNLELEGNLSMHERVISHKLMLRYDKVALGCLISFWLLACKLYVRDKRRFYKSF